MSYSTIRTQIQTELGGRTDHNTLINDQINFAYEEVTTTFEIKELQTTAYTTTASGQFKYLLPSDCFALYTVKDETNNTPLEEADMKSFDDLDETETGTPKKYAQFNTALYLFDSVPDDNSGSNYTIKIRYWKRVPRLSADNDNLLTPNEWEHGIRLLASAYTHFALNNLERAQFRMEDYKRWLVRFTQPKAVEKMKAHKGRIQFSTS